MALGENSHEFFEFEILPFLSLSIFTLIANVRDGDDTILKTTYSSLSVRIIRNDSLS